MTPNNSFQLTIPLLSLSKHRQPNPIPKHYLTGTSSDSSRHRTKAVKLTLDFAAAPRSNSLFIQHLSACERDKALYGH